MDRSKRNVRLEAAKAFMASLDELGDVLSPQAEAKVKPASPEVAKDNSKSTPNPPETELDSFEQAVAELQAYIESQSP